MREEPRGRAGKSHDDSKGPDFRPCFLLALRCRHLLVATYLNGSCRSVTRGAETHAAIFMGNAVLTDTSLQPEDVLALCCCLLFIYSCDGKRNKCSFPSPSPGKEAFTLTFTVGEGWRHVPLLQAGLLNQSHGRGHVLGFSGRDLACCWLRSHLVT